ncbi:uncharacterized protein LOC142338324 [Convolutriloba macropyga]|uniref:uncharacterized protein LOC142338324 n=1 Tax=Convolutriloba macropyga TaxID=536237 RepID=UPI003F51B4B5
MENFMSFTNTTISSLSSSSSTTTAPKLATTGNLSETSSQFSATTLVSTSGSNPDPAIDCKTENSTRLSEWVQQPCPCYCGRGVQTSSRYCTWVEYNSTSRTCMNRTETESDTNPCDNSTLYYEEECFNKTCVLTELSHKTADVEYGATDDGVSFKAYMNSGNYCHIGELDIGEINDRERGWVDVYPLSLNCDNICIPSTSKAFDYIAATISNQDGWIPEYGRRISIVTEL